MAAAAAAAVSIDGGHGDLTPPERIARWNRHSIETNFGEEEFSADLMNALCGITYQRLASELRGCVCK